MLYTGGLCVVLRFTAPLILISEKFQSKYIDIEQYFVCPNCTSSNNTFGCLIDMGVA